MNMNMQFHALRRRDWLQQYANAKSLQTFASLQNAKVCKSFCKLLEHLFYFILFYMCERHNAQ